MSKREVIAYAITHAPPGVKGGPYEGDYDEAVPTLRAAFRGERQRAKLWLPIVRSVVPTARIIRIVRKARPSEASAVEVLRAMVAWVDSKGGGFNAIIARARRVLAASGPDPSEMVRAVETLREQAFRGPARRTAALEALLDTFDAYRKAGGK